MRLSRVLAAFAVLALPSATRAADIMPLYPDAGSFAFGVNIKAITQSPLGKKTIGNDKPFDVTRKMLRVLFPEDIMPITQEAIKPLETVANRLENVTVVGSLFGQNSPPPIVVFLEGEINEDEYIKAAEALAKAEKNEFFTEKLGDRKLLQIGTGNSAIFGLRVSKELFVIASHRDLITEVLEKHAGLREGKVKKSLAEWVKKAKPAETPIWFAAGEMDGLMGILGGVATITLKDDADFRIEVHTDTQELAKTIVQLTESLVNYLEGSKTPQARVWKAAGITVKQDGKTAIATGSIPGKLLIDEYAKQK